MNRYFFGDQPDLLEKVRGQVEDELENELERRHNEGLKKTLKIVGLGFLAIAAITVLL